jgi:predicted nucleic acid-binding protein
VSGSGFAIFIDADLIISAFDDAAKGREPQQVERAKQLFQTWLQSAEYTLFTNPLVKYEVLRSVPTDSSRYRKLSRAFRFITIIDLSERDADLASRIWQQAESGKAFKPSTKNFDILHFSCAMNNGLRIETQNRRDFPSIAQLYESISHIQQSN